MEKKIEIIPPGFQSVNVYLIVKGAGRLLEFLKEAFGAEEKFRMPNGDGTLQHSEVRVGDVLLEAADAGGEWQAMPANLHYYVDNADRVYRQAVKAGATSLYEPREMAYGDREGGVKDSCGNNWFIATHKAGKSYRPEPLRDVTPGFSVRGAAEFLAFLEKAFDAEVLGRDENKAGTVVHAVVRIGDTALELSEAHGEWGPRPIGLHYYVENCDVIFRGAVGAGAKPIYEVQDKPYGERNGGVQDAWGNQWYIATRLEVLSKEKLDAGAKAQTQF
jgi:uncharacterized glyoxalase superfamily protein PhnB